MEKKLFFIYTNPRFMATLYQPVMAEAFDGDAKVAVRFTLDNSLLLDTLDNGGEPTPGVVRRLYNQAANCVKGGAHCIVVGCTALNTATAALKGLAEVPLISVDEPMVEAVAAAGHRRVAVLSHAGVNAMTIRRRLQAHGLEADTFVAEGAEAAMAAEDGAGFAHAMQSVARDIRGYDAIALGHITAERVDFSSAAVPVYRCGEWCISAVRKALADK